MRRPIVLLFCFLAAAVASSSAQVAESANSRQLTVTAGGEVSGFRSDSGAKAAGIAVDSPDNTLLGLGTYVDVHFSHWFQIEGEARWLRFNEFLGEHQDTYLIGPRVPIKEFGRATVYGKVLIGAGKMTFPANYGYGTFTALAYGGSLDYRMSRKLTVKAVDFEVQQWPKWLNSGSLYPYGVSVGLGYRVF